MLVITVLEVCVSSVEAYSMFSHLKLYPVYFCFVGQLFRTINYQMKSVEQKICYGLNQVFG